MTHATEVDTVMEAENKKTARRKGEWLSSWFDGRGSHGEDEETEGRTGEGPG